MEDTISSAEDWQIQAFVPNSFTFGAGEEQGRLYIDEKDGKFKFEGDVDASARIFFEHLIKQYIDPDTWELVEEQHVDKRALLEKIYEKWDAVKQLLIEE